MRLNYAIKTTKAFLKSSIISCDINDALFYIDKGDIVSFKLELSDTYNFSSLLVVENLQNTTKIKSNTEAILATDIYINNEPYYYEVVSVTDKFISLTEILNTTPFDVVELDGKYYTNTVINNYELTNQLRIQTVPVISKSRFKVKYASKHIEITIDRSSSAPISCKPQSNYNINVLKVNDGQVYIPSFYITLNKNKNIKIIEGSKIIKRKKEFLFNNNGVIQPKEMVESLVTSNLYLTDQNKLVSKEAFLKPKEVLIEYNAINSTNIFDIKTDLYLKINLKGYLEIADRDSFDIKITKVIDNSKLSVYPNKYLNKYGSAFNPRKLGLMLKPLSDNYTKALSRYIAPSHLINPSRVYYIKTEDKIYYQESKTKFQPTTINLSELENFLD